MGAGLGSSGGKVTSKGSEQGKVGVVGSREPRRKRRKSLERADEATLAGSCWLVKRKSNEPWPAWLDFLGVILQSKRPMIRFQVRAHA